MKTFAQYSRAGWISLAMAGAVSTLLFGALPAVAAAAAVKVTLSGDQEVPPVQTAGTGSGTITVNDDMSVTGSVTTKGIAGTMAHVHEAAAGTNGPVVIKLEQNGDTWSVPAGTKLTPAQFASFKAGNLYVNVHTAANQKGEMRGQLKP